MKKGTKHRPLDEVEMYDLLVVAYPERFGEDDDDAWERAQEFVDEMEGFDDISDLLGRVVMLTMPMSSPLTNTLTHCLGKVEVGDGRATMVAAVKRPAE